MTNIDHQKDQFALEVAEQVMNVMRMRLKHEGQTKAQIQLLILDAVEFGIQLGGMGLKEGE